MASRAGLLQHPPMKAQINPGLSLSLDDKRGSRQVVWIKKLRITVSTLKPTTSSASLLFGILAEAM
jgi:hypothetical protein